MRAILMLIRNIFRNDNPHTRVGNYAWNVKWLIDANQATIPLIGDHERKSLRSLYGKLPGLELMELMELMKSEIEQR